MVEGDRVRGTLYLPAQARGPVGAVALAHGWSMVAGGDLEDYAAAIVEQGLAALTLISATWAAATASHARKSIRSGRSRISEPPFPTCAAAPRWTASASASGAAATAAAMP